MLKYGVVVLATKNSYLMLSYSKLHIKHRKKDKMIYLSPVVNKKMSQGIDYAAKAVVPAIGPLGKNIAYDPKTDVPYIVNSGRDIIKHINLEDKAVMVGVDMIKLAMEKAYLSAGDGAVTTAAIINKVWKESEKLDAAGMDTMALMRGLRKASELAVKYLQEQSDEVDDDKYVYGLAKSAASGRDDIAGIVEEVYQHIGPNGYATVEDSQMAETHISYFKGVKWDHGYTAFFEDQSITQEKPAVLLVNRVISEYKPLIPILTEARDNSRALLIIAREIKEDVANALHFVRDKSGVDVMAVNAPGFGEVRDQNMKYFGIMFNGVVFDDLMAEAHPEMTLADCGSVEMATIKKNETVLQGIPNPKDPLVEQRKAKLYDDLKHIKNEDERYRIEQMLTPLAGDTANISVGGVMEMEMFEKKYLVDNSIHSTYAAIKSGFLPGGGKGYMLAIPAVLEFAETLNGDEKNGAQLLAKALAEPCFRITENAGFDGKSTVEKLLENKDKYYGFNVLSEKFEDFKESGVLDSTAVVCSVISTAVSSVSTAISVAACVVAEEEKDFY